MGMEHSLIMFSCIFTDPGISNEGNGVEMFLGLLGNQKCYEACYFTYIILMFCRNVIIIILLSSRVFSVL